MKILQINQSHISGEAAIAREEYPIEWQAKHYIELYQQVLDKKYRLLGCSESLGMIALQEYPIKLQAKRYIELGKESAITLRKNIP
jgi:hypothetical protein